MKYCGICKQVKPKGGFYKCSSTKDGLATKCKDCQSIRNKTFQGIADAMAEQWG